ncbi:MAG TPA: GntR family transcriptional regulator [Jiangellaceae bacterium]
MRTIDHGAAMPVWRQLADLLRSQIESGELVGMIPSERTLWETHDVSRGTVRKAVDALVEEGLLERVQGRGTFVKNA